jgi:hypothetical protein
MTDTLPAMPEPDSEILVQILPVKHAEEFRLLRFDRVQPDREQICRLVGLQPGRDNHRRWYDQVNQMLAELPRLMRPRGLFRVDQVTGLEPRRVVLASGAAFEGAVGAFLQHSTRIATFVVTIGSALERLSRAWLRAGRVMQGTVADAIASEAAEATAQRLKGEVRAWAQARGLEITPPYSPGYCGMNLRQQVPLFASLPTQQINVRITPSCLMLPIKSVSGLIGIGPADKVSPAGYPCEACDHPDCVQRRTPFVPRA